MQKVIEEIAAERRRQIEQEGWSVEHDDSHRDGELARAAACYAMRNTRYFDFAVFWIRCWPWSREWWKPFGGTRRNLIKAAALIVAEIERIDRLPARS